MLEYNTEVGNQEFTFGYFKLKIPLKYQIKNARQEREPYVVVKDMKTY